MKLVTVPEMEPNKLYVGSEPGFYRCERTGVMRSLRPGVWEPAPNRGVFVEVTEPTDGMDIVHENDGKKMEYGKVVSVHRVELSDGSNRLFTSLSAMWDFLKNRTWKRAGGDK